MTIVVDCRMLNASGIGVYLRGILPYLLNSNNNFILIGDYNKLNFYDNYSNIIIYNYNTKPFSIKEILFFTDSKIKKIINSANIFFTPFYNIPGGIKIPVYSIIHDIIFPDIPELTSKLGIFLRMLFFKNAYKKSTKIFTVSEFSKSRIIYHLGSKKPIIIASPGIQESIINFNNITKNITKQKKIVFIGNIKKHKGLDYLIDAFISFINEGYDYKLILIGSKDSFIRGKFNISEKIKSINIDSIEFTGFISDKEMLKHLSEAELLVQPSLYEGFGIPPLEAMFLGTKALISDIPVFKEIYQDFPVTYFKSKDSNDLKDKLVQILIENKSNFFTLSKELQNKYSFKNTADIILKNITE